MVNIAKHEEIWKLANTGAREFLFHHLEEAGVFGLVRFTYGLGWAFEVVFVAIRLYLEEMVYILVCF